MVYSKKVPRNLPDQRRHHHHPANAKLGWHVNFTFSKYPFRAVIIFVMVAINTIKIVARLVMRMNYRTTGLVVKSEIVVQLFIGSAFVSVVPENYEG